MADVRAPRVPSGDSAKGGDGAASLPHCIDCGRCCFAPDAEYIRVFAVDLERMDARARGYTVDHGGRISMRMAEGRCAALVIDAGAGTFVCAIYEGRPDACRWLQRGSGVCLSDRREKAGATRVALDVLRTARG